MKKILLLIAVLITLMPVCSAAAISVSYQISPEILMPGDVADGVLTISNPSTEDIKVTSVTFYGEGVEIKPRSTYQVGTVPAGGSYQLPFSLKALETGRHGVQAVISTANGTVTQNMIIVVDDNFPSIVPSTSLYMNEVNEMGFYVSSPVELKDVKVEPLFRAEPKIVFIGTVIGQAEGSIKFIPVTEKPLKFKISFYNGRNYHEIIKTVEVGYLDSKGVFLNVSTAYSSSYIGDVTKLFVEVSNLRNDDIYKVRVYASSNLGTISENNQEIAKIESGGSKKITFLYSPDRSGRDTIDIGLEYYDEFGNKRDAAAQLTFEVLENLALTVTNIEVKKEIEGYRVSGDVSNNGRGEAYNTYVTISCPGWSQDYFLGNIDPSDFQSFDLVTKCNGSATVIVDWSNEVGKTYELTKEVKLKSELQIKTEKMPFILWISAAVVVVVIGIVVFVFYRYTRK
jgi:hypothetical protein